MVLSTYESIHYKAFCKRLTVTLAAIIGCYACICTPIYLWTTSNILVQQTVFPIIWDYVMMAVNYLFFWVGFSAVIYATFSYGLVTLKQLLPLYGLAALVRYFANLLASYFVMGFPTAEDFFTLTLWFTLLDVLLDCVLMGVVVLIVYMLLKKRVHAPDACYHLKDYLPYQSTFALSNPLCRAAFLASLLPSAIRLLSRVRYDLYIGSAQSRVDLIWQIVSYASDVLLAPIGYLVMLLLINRMYLLHEEAHARYEADI